MIAIRIAKQGQDFDMDDQTVLNKVLAETFFGDSPHRVESNDSVMSVIDIYPVIDQSVGEYAAESVENFARVTQNQIPIGTIFIFVDWSAFVYSALGNNKWQPVTMLKVSETDQRRYSSQECKALLVQELTKALNHYNQNKYESEQDELPPEITMPVH
jgi:hypothetical protein